MDAQQSQILVTNRLQKRILKHDQLLNFSKVMGIQQSQILYILQNYKILQPSPAISFY